MVSLTQPLYIAFHMILIGMASLGVKMPMGILLHQPKWRIATISVAVAVSIVADIVILSWPKLKEALRVQSLSEETRPFMVFLWFCNIFLLLDSLLCIARIPWTFLPLLLIGAAERRTEELKNRSDRDALTGLFSRQYLMEQMEAMLEKK